MLALAHEFVLGQSKAQWSAACCSHGGMVTTPAQPVYAYLSLSIYYIIRSGKSDPVLFKRGLKTGAFLLPKGTSNFSPLRHRTFKGQICLKHVQAAETVFELDRVSFSTLDTSPSHLVRADRQSVGFPHFANRAAPGKNAEHEKKSAARTCRQINGNADSKSAEMRMIGLTMTGLSCGPIDRIGGRKRSGKGTDLVSSDSHCFP